jgi:hypothetical protein
MVLLRESGMTQLTRQRLGLIKALPVLAGEARVDQFVCRFRPRQPVTFARLSVKKVAAEKELLYLGLHAGG